MAALESESLAKSREQRKNAGTKMSKLLADELGEDEFYKTALGGFAEESGDEEYVSEDEQSDQVDSDFSLSETDEIIDQDDEDDSKKKRKKTFYKKPTQPKVEGKEKKTAEKAPTEKKIKNDKAVARASSRKSTRAATVRSSDKHRKRMEGKKVDFQYSLSKHTSSQPPPPPPHKNRNNPLFIIFQNDKKQVKFSQLRPLTQKELLAEAEVTEQLNIASLKAYQQMEETKKKAKALKPVRKEPMIRYLSLSMPVIEVNEEIKVVDDGGNENQSETLVEKNSEKTPELKCSRNFIIFTDPKTFPGNYFTSNKVSIPQKAYCPVTGLPAKYKDPVTSLPYATAQAFRYIREHYAKQTAEVDIKPSDGRMYVSLKN